MLYLIGPFPPPRHGVSAINEIVAKIAAAAGITTEILNTAPSSLSRSLAVRLARIGNQFRAFRSLGRCRHPHRSIVYLSLSGGYGLVWDTILVRQARRRGLQVILHHHSFRYVDADFWLMRRLVAAAGPGALHVVLCALMGERLAQRYAGVQRTLVLSNSGLLSTADLQASLRQRLTTVGYMANLSPEKGLLDVLDLAEAAATRIPSVVFQIAGPFESPAIEAQFRQRAAGLANLRYVGPVYGDAKKHFLESSDAFVFPTRYRNEAEPLVILEALQAGCPVIAYSRGCIDGVLNQDCGLCVPREQGFTEPALARLAHWLAQDNAFQRASAAAAARYAQIQLAADGARTAFVQAITPAP